jgi:hypothetical protein
MSRAPAALPSAVEVDSRAMLMLVFTVLGLCAMVTAYAFGVPGPVCALLFLGGLFTGALLVYSKPIIDWLTKP